MSGGPMPFYVAIDEKGSFFDGGSSTVAPLGSGARPSTTLVRLLPP